MSVGNEILQLVEGDVFTEAGPAILGFLNDEAKANGDPFKMAAAWVKLQGAMVAAAPNLEGDAVTQLSEIIAGKIANVFGKAQSPSTTVSSIIGTLIAEPAPQVSSSLTTNANVEIGRAVDYQGGLFVPHDQAASEAAVVVVEPALPPGNNPGTDRPDPTKNHN